MSNQKKPAPAAKKPTIDFNSEFNQDRLSLDPALKAELAAKNLVPHWINANTYKKQGFHQRGWVPYKRDQIGELTLAERLSGKSPDGFVVRGEDILAVMEKDRHTAYKQFMEQKRRRMQDPMKKAANEMRDMAREQGMKDVVEVHDEYADKYSKDDE